MNCLDLKQIGQTKRSTFSRAKFAAHSFSSFAMLILAMHCEKVSQCLLGHSRAIIDYSDFITTDLHMDGHWSILFSRVKRV